MDDTVKLTSDECYKQAADALRLTTPNVEKAREWRQLGDSIKSK